MTGERDIADTLSQLSPVARQAHEYEKTYRAHSSVSTDPFYSVPPSSATASPGTLLRVEHDTNAELYNLPPNHALSRIMYQSQRSDGSAVPVTAYILWPYTARKFSNVEGYPMVAWAHGTSGVNSESAPSNLKTLWHDFQVVYQLALNGYVVIATDYAGLGPPADAEGKTIAHEYLTGPAQGADVVFSVRAAREAFSELSKEFIIIGSSEGGQAAWAAAERLHDHPLPPDEFNLLGTIPISPLTKLLHLPNSANVIPLLLMMLVPGLQQRSSDFKPSDILTPKGVEIFDAYTKAQGCNTLFFQLLPLDLPHTDIVHPDWRSNRHIHAYQQMAYTGRKPFAGPLLVIHGDADPLVTTESVDKAVEETAHACPEVRMEYHLLPGVSHVPAMYVSQTIWMDWIADRFAAAGEDGRGKM